MNVAQASAHICHTGPFSGMSVAAIATSTAGRDWLDRIRLLIGADATGQLGDLRTAINLHLAEVGLTGAP